MFEHDKSQAYSWGWGRMFEHDKSQTAIDNLQSCCDDLHDSAVRFGLMGEEAIASQLWKILHDATGTLVTVREAVNGNTN